MYTQSFRYNVHRAVCLLTLCLVCLATVALEVPKAYAQNSNHNVILTFDTSGSLADAYVNPDTHRRIKQYLSKIMFEEWDEMLISDEDSFVIPTHAKMLKPLLNADVSWAVYHFGNAVNEKRPLKPGNLDDNILDTYYPTKFADQTTRIDTLLKVICELTTESYLAGKQLYWIYVSDDVLDTGIVGSSGNIELGRLAQQYYWQPVMSLKIDGAGNAWGTNAPSEVLLQVIRVVDIDLGMEQELIETLDQVILALESLKSLADALETAAAATGNIEGLSTVRDTLKRNRQQLDSVRTHFSPTGADMEDARAKYSEAGRLANAVENQLDAVERAYKDYLGKDTGSDGKVSTFETKLLETDATLETLYGRLESVLQTTKETGQVPDYKQLKKAVEQAEVTVIALQQEQETDPAFNVPVIVTLLTNIKDRFTQVERLFDQIQEHIPELIANEPDAITKETIDESKGGLIRRILKIIAIILLIAFITAIIICFIKPDKGENYKLEAPDLKPPQVFVLKKNDTIKLYPFEGEGNVYDIKAPNAYIECTGKLGCLGHRFQLVSPQKDTKSDPQFTDSAFHDGDVETDKEATQAQEPMHTRIVLGKSFNVPTQTNSGEKIQSLILTRNIVAEPSPNQRRTQGLSEVDNTGSRDLDV